MSRLAGRGDLDEEMEHLVQGCAEPMVFGCHEMRAARGRQLVSSAFSRVLRFRITGRRLATHAGWLPLLDS